MAEPRTILGLRVGSSFDGVDAALLSSDRHSPESTFSLVGSLQRPLPETLSTDLRNGNATDDVQRALAKEMLAAVRSARKLGTRTGPLSLVGVETDLPCTTQPGLAALANELTVPCVGGFSACDRAVGGLGGSGALAWGVMKLLGDDRLSRVVVHLGAAAHLTFIPADARSGDVASFDVAPAGWWLDAACRDLLGTPFDRDGAAASRGRPVGQLVHQFLHEVWSRREGPARLDPPEWSRRYAPRVAMLAEREKVTGEDLLATLVEATAAAIASAVASLTERPHQVILAGGGALNIHLASRIRARLSPSSTIASDKLGIPARSVASAAVGVLAASRLDGTCAHCPAATAAETRAVLGILAQPPEIY
jgi:anhydro-N-acetylmuramic acid kinase